MNIYPTQVKRYRQCARLIGFIYVEDIKPPPSPKQEFGSEGHKHLERWLKDGLMPPNTPSGRTAQQGLTLLPIPGPTLLVEHEISYAWGSSPVQIKGLVDCLTKYKSESYEDCGLLIDHKFTSSLKYAMSRDELLQDPQAIIYAVWPMLHWGLSTVVVRWIYYVASNPSSGIRVPAGVRAVEGIFHRDDPIFHAQLRALGKDLQAIYDIRTCGVKGIDLPPTPTSCGAYGGCYFQKKCALSAEQRAQCYFR